MKDQYRGPLTMQLFPNSSQLTNSNITIPNTTLY